MRPLDGRRFVRSSRSQYSFLPSRWARAAMITATECAKPCSTVALVWLRLRMQLNQFFMWEGLASEMKGRGP